MSTLLSPGGTLDDIVFEGRNQAYGAFQLRRTYQRHLGSALAITTSLCALMLLVPLALRYFAPPVVVIPPKTGDVPPIAPTIYEFKQVTPPAAGGRAAVATAPRVAAARIPTVVPDEKVTKSAVETPVPPALDADPTAGLATASSTATPGNGSGSGTGDGGGSGPGADVAPTTPPTEAFVLTAEVMPSFEGGPEALRRYLQKNLRYPAPALAAQATGRVFVSFVVKADGSVADVQVLKGLGFGTEEAAARVVRDMPAWKPGRQNNRSVAVRFTLPITFQFE